PIALHWAIVALLAVRIILKRRPTGVSLAWLSLVTAVPFVGAGIYLMVGELWLPRHRIERFEQLIEPYNAIAEQLEQVAGVDESALDPIAKALNDSAHGIIAMPATRGSTVTLFRTAKDCFDAMRADIDNAKESCHLLFYIWEPGGQTDTIAQALIEASERGVSCKILVDGVGSKHFLRSKEAQNLRTAGVQIVEALPVGRLRFHLKRIDIRNHRKILVVDGRIGYTGSLNMIDPARFKQHANVGQWIDVMARVEGPGAYALDLTFISDWAIETGTVPEDAAESLLEFDRIPMPGKTPLQVVPSGPGPSPQMIHEMLLLMVYRAGESLVITTPYFIPSEAMLHALVAASKRGVDVQLVVPERVDSTLVRHASRSYYEDLLDAGVKIWLYRGGLLHAKTVTVDGTVSLIGTVNMDKRSFWINFEVSLFVYDIDVTREVRQLQDSYIEDAERVDPVRWANRGLGDKLMQNTLQLFAPIL
ncbi:MAG TPA: cardiolipin synthase, partial [Phycisphaerales bacterium]|nr:cardiolipin synthase [Phycisphaerales bacterium]